MIVNFMTEIFTTSSKGSETSRNSEKYSLELKVNSTNIRFETDK